MELGSLAEYRRKRDFKRTPEPGARVAKSKSGRLFVIQKHAASRLHYDFRLELDGVLLSWAVPKGPSLDPAEKRLAVQVEDHPVEYATFEGVIPEDEYGGGTVMLWDRGEWEPEEDPRAGMRQGKLKFTLHGRKLRGSWALVRMGGSRGDKTNWLLIKHRDRWARPERDYSVTEEEPRSVASRRTMETIAARRERVWSSRGRDSARRARSTPRPTLKQRLANKHTRTPRRLRARAAASRARGKIDPSGLTDARRAAPPAFVTPQLATLVKDAPAGDDWIHEIKFDGYRLQAIIRGGEVRLLTRHAKDWTERFPEIATAAAALPVRQAILDGEVVVVGPGGVTSFQALQNVLRSGERTALAYYVFDIPHCEGFDLTRTPLLERKELLEHVLRGSGDGPIRYSDHITGQGGAAFREACKSGVEGIVSKRADAPYQSGRTHSWVKVKCVKRQEFVVGGYTDPTGSRTGSFGALLLGYYENGELVYCGRVGTGFTATSLRQIMEQLTRRETASSPFLSGPVGRKEHGVHWVKPELVAEVAFGEWTQDGLLRHPSFQGLREDKQAREVVREVSNAIGGSGASGRRGGTTSARPNGAAKMKTGSKRRTSKARAGGSSEQEREVAGVRISHPDRVLYADPEVSKASLAEYYAAVAEWMLPHVAGRPLSFVRCPQGQQGKCFFQKHLGDTMPEHLRGITIQEREGKDVYHVLDDAAGLVQLVQIGVLEVHVWGCREDDIERPDCIVFDLDPGPQVAWGDVMAGAREVRRRLDEYKLKSFVKTTGGKGLHVVAPLTPRAGWDDVKSFAESVARDMERDAPEKYVATMAKSKRTGKVFVDYLRNGRGATFVAPYSTRARPGATVSTPLAWDELTARLDPSRFGVAALQSRLQRRKSDPWREYFRIRQALPAVAAGRRKDR